MPVVRVVDIHDDRLADYRALKDITLRSRLEPARGLYMAESIEVITRAAEAGHRARSVLMAERWLPTMSEVLTQLDPDGGLPVYVAAEDVLREITGFHLHRGALAAMHRPAQPAAAALLEHARTVVVLEDIVDHTNVGAVFRSCAALGADAVLVTPRCADPLYRRSVRVSMGTVFQVPWARLERWPQDVSLLHAASFTIAALALSDAAVDLDDFASDRPARVALVLGAEGDGLSAGALYSADVVVRIPMFGGVDSLNVAAASAVALWALR